MTMMAMTDRSGAATNSATDPGGGSQSLTGSGPITVNAVTLALVEQVRDLSGNWLADNASIPIGGQIYFVFTVDNITPAKAIDLKIANALNEADFIYVPNSIETTTVPTGSNDAALWAATWIAATDAVGVPDDIASIVDTGGGAGLDRVTLGMVSGQSNQQVDLPGNTMQAIRFKVTVKK